MSSLAAQEMLALHHEGALPLGWSTRVQAPIEALLNLGNEEVSVRRLTPDLCDPSGRALEIGDVVCVRSAQRITWRRVIGRRLGTALLRGDTTPFADGWFGGPHGDRRVELLGCIEPRLLDRALANLSTPRALQAQWLMALAIANAKAKKRRLQARARELPLRFWVRRLAVEEWPDVQAFWLRASGRELTLAAPRHAYVVGLFAQESLVGVNVQLVTGAEAYSAYTLIERAYRGQGGGRLLIEEAIGVAEELELRRVYVHIHARNVPSLAAYRRARFSFSHWWTDEADPLLAAERQWRVFERLL